MVRRPGDRGDLNVNKHAISGTPAWEEDWSLDMTGNWTDYVQKTSGSTDLDQDRAHDEANEITEIDGSSTHVAHDKNGNMTKTPKPSDWSADYDLTYDAWNRLVKVQDGQTTVAEYAYDGRNFRVGRTVGSATRRFYYNRAWQCLEERPDGPGTSPDRQFVWGLRYVDDLILRDRVATCIGTGTGACGKLGTTWLPKNAPEAGAGRVGVCRYRLLYSFLDSFFSSSNSAANPSKR